MRRSSWSGLPGEAEGSCSQLHPHLGDSQLQTNRPLPALHVAQGVVGQCFEILCGNVLKRAKGWSHSATSARFFALNSLL